MASACIKYIHNVWPGIKANKWALQHIKVDFTLPYENVQQCPPNTTSPPVSKGPANALTSRPAGWPDSQTTPTKVNRLLRRDTWMNQEQLGQEEMANKPR